MTICDYTYRYHNLLNDKIERFTCKETALNSGECKFHDKDYAQNNETEVTRLITQKIEESIEFKLPILCIGYKIPKLEIENIKFSTPVSFTNAEFFGNGIFDNCHFLDKTDFSNTHFKQDASFLNVIFHEDADFSDMTVDNEVYFQNSSFMKNNLFQHGIIQKASFLNANFQDVDFTDTTFNEWISFTLANFNGKTTFNNTTFTKGSDFSYSRFYSTTYFVETNFLMQSDFRNIIFEKPHEIYFDSDLSWVSLIETDVSKIKFGTKTLWSNRNTDCEDYKIYDEWKIEQNIEPELSIETVMDVYRNLRENFDFYLRYETSGEFFIREMELKRKYKDNDKSKSPKIIKKHIVEQAISPLGIYNIISKYGHSLLRPILISIPILEVFSILFFMQHSSDPTLVKSSFQELVLMSVFRSTGSFFPFYSFVEKVDYLDIILRILLLPISATFFVGLKRKLERKYRH